MDFYVVLGRPGMNVLHRRRKTGKVGRRQTGQGGRHEVVPDQVRRYHPLIQEAPVINFHVNIAVTELQNKYLLPQLKYDLYFVARPSLRIAAYTITLNEI